MSGWYPEAVRLNITTQEYFNPRGYTLISIVDHITDGTDSRDWLQHAANDSSVHFLIRVENGKGVVYQFMPVEWAAWGNGRYSNNNPYMPAWCQDLIYRGININKATVSIEHERDWPFDTMPPQAMTDASIKLHQWLVDNYTTIPRDREHIIGHYQIDHVDRANCPGGPGGKYFPFDQIISAINHSWSGEPVWIPGAKYPINVDEFAVYWTSEPKAMTYFGLPIDAEHAEVLSDGNTYTVQYFERARFELHGTSVLLGLLGSEELAERG